MDVAERALRGRRRSTSATAITAPTITARGVVYAAGAVLSLRVLLQVVGPADRDSWQTVADGAAVLALAVLFVVMVRRRGNAHRHELPVWRWLTVMVGVVAVAAATRLGWTILAPDAFATARHCVDAATQLAACGAAYQALIWWDRGATRIFNPGDWLNGVSATLAATAVGNLVWHAAPSLLDGESTWASEAVLLQAAAAVVLIGTIPSVANLGGLAGERRFWIVSAGITTLACAPAVASFVPASATLLEHVADVGVPLVAWASLRRADRTAAPRHSTTQATTIGALVVLFAAVLVLVTVTQLDPTHRGVTVGFALGAIAGVSVRMMHIIRDLALLAETRQEALTDELTGVANRRALMKRLASPEVTTGTLLLLDVNRFKEINDRLGHAVGDELLCVLATRLLAALSLDAQLARLGGDEFAALLPGRDQGDHLEVAERIVAAASEPVTIGDRRIQVSVSVGAATMADDDPMDGAELLRRADAAMYVAKSAGVGLAVYDPQLDADQALRGRLVDQLRALGRAGTDAAIGDGDAGRLLAYYQPQVSTNTGRPDGVEALVRWDHPTLGVLPPAAFLPLVEEHGLMEMVTTTVMRQAVHDAIRWNRSGRRLHVSVNISTSCLTNPGLVPLVAEVLGETGLAPELLVIEVTETDAISSPDAAAAALNALVALGVGVSIDDYGTGYSSLAYLKDLPVSELKLDRSFTVDLVHDARTAHIVAATIELAHRLDIDVVGEGVEDFPTLHALQTLGCERTQGYLHGAPMSEPDFVRWLDHHVPQDIPARTVA
ncbi:diguanylate cyclase (GGDEF) domain-containing protein [Jatrophihabitans endophyticus]|uniref:Diguanylate cyclase (GGDEF) domain-containing protein n=1 Tax=Jatrophihabitans endophyticus TaxID=1206085 RepID=A0A1M5T216_9ACTN|nr:GGDEF domain-containing phosphodiesterase [Jatrophihabitans endophyticus]SHH44708.1 diguanylate cyclase (GGDEF) domain-containing protein [Jatrophihabitans endophyticus]